MNILIIDGNNLGHRGYNTQPLSHNGVRTEVMYMGITMLRSYIDQFLPDECIVCWDSGRDKDRLAIYPEYKAKTKKYTLEEEVEFKEFIAQMTRLQDMVKVFRIPQFRLKGREADDLIYSLIHHRKQKDPDAKFFVISTDKDFFQLFEHWDDTVVYNPISKKCFGANHLSEVLDIPPDYFVMYKAFIGDPSDNIPGIKGIGPKKAAKLINGLFFNKFELKKKELDFFDKALAENDDLMSMMMELIRFKLFNKDEIIKGFIDNSLVDATILTQEVTDLFTAYGFERYLSNLDSFTEPFNELLRKRIEHC